MMTDDKNDLIEWVQNLEDKELLNTLMLIKDHTSNGDWYDELSRKDRESIKRGVSDHENGQTMTSQEFWHTHGK